MSIDGRTARRLRTRQAVVDATVDLLDAGNLRPTPREIALASGVSERSIFRCFAGREDLLGAVIEANFQRLVPLLGQAEDFRGSMRTRVRRLVDRRLRIWAEMSGPARAARHVGHLSPRVRADGVRIRGILSEQVRWALEPELAPRAPAARRELVLMIDIALSFEAWNLLVTGYRQSPRQIRRLWTQEIVRLLASPA